MRARAWRQEDSGLRRWRAVWDPQSVWEALQTSDERLAWAALRAAQLTAGPAPGDLPALVARVVDAPRCCGAVPAGSALGAALRSGRLPAYALMNALFARVSYRSDVHPPLIAVAGHAGLIFETRWVVWALAGSRIDPAQAAPALLGAVRRGYDQRTADEARLAFVEPLDGPAAEAVEPGCAAG